jgi:uncharacterized protein (TIGR02453 family)
MSPAKRDTTAASGPAKFAGFPAEAFEFYEQLEADNSRLWWQGNKPRYDAVVRGPMAALCALIEDPWGPFHIFRPYVDTRFAKGKPPYKTHIGAYSESEGGAGFYLQLSAAGLMAATGYYAMAPDQLERFRQVVDDEARGKELQRLVAAAERKGYSIGAISELKTAPRGYPKDHPRIGLLRRKGLMGSITWAPEDWMYTAKAKDRVVSAWKGFGAVNEWLDTHVGPSTLPPEDAEGF